MEMFIEYWYLWLLLAVYCFSPFLFVVTDKTEKDLEPAYGPDVLEPLDAVGYTMGRDPDQF